MGFGDHALTLAPSSDSELRRLFGQCYARFAPDQMFVDLVIELEIVLDDYLNRMPKVWEERKK